MVDTEGIIKYTVIKWTGASKLCKVFYLDYLYGGIATVSIMYIKRKQRLADLRKKRMRARNQKLATAAIAGTFTALVFMNTKVEACSTTYTVVKNDTLYSLSRKYNVSTDQLMAVNGLKSEKIIVGQQIMVPDHVQSVKPEELSSLYTVQKGDTLYALAKKSGVSINELTKINHLQSDKIYIGQKIKLTVASQTKDIKPPMYKVNPGDTLWGIAKRFGVKVEDLKKVNGLRLDMVLIGQNLTIPGPAIFTKVQVVGAADNFTVEFQYKDEPFVLTVAYGSAPEYEKKSGQQVTVVHKNGALISIY
ncbi:Cell division suppressor protein YneA [Neobacillus rhizosphaerae]|uniref:Cell division suppressor protein YneA n=2 Tax=Neobacillus rhizosphaerae TaxID=2880965 RepID=A0ABM9ENM3_9BACI|nr:Cell division suppressor protein YneA [Neobacillus rhizosphaerae]